MNGAGHETNKLGSIIADTWSRQLTEPAVRHLQLGPIVGHTLLIPAYSHDVNTVLVVDTNVSVQPVIPKLTKTNTDSVL